MINEFSQITGFSVDDLLGVSRKQSLAVARSVYWWLLYETGRTYQEIGQLCDRTHSAIINGVKNVRNGIKFKDARFCMLVNKVEQLKNDYMCQIERSVKVVAPKTVNDGEKTVRINAIDCDYCHGEGYHFHGGHSAKFKKSPDDPDYTPCPFCQGTGQLTAVVNVKFVPYGEVKQIKAYECEH